MSRLFGLAALALLMGLMFYLPQPETGGAPLSMTLGFLLLAGFVCGKLGNRIGLPGITGYLIAGIAMGPSLLGIMDHGDVRNLELINSFALTLIALTAGGEVNLRRIARSIRAFLMMIAGQVVITFVGVLVLMAWALHYFPGEFTLQFSGLVAVGALFAVTAIANSPSSTIAVIVETGAKGRMTELTLGITIIKDIMVIVAFALTFGFVTQILDPSQAGQGNNIAAELSWEIGGSITFGIVLGVLIIGYMKYLGTELPIFIIALSYLVAVASRAMHLHGLLVCMTAGLAVSNLSSRGHSFIAAIERGSLPLYVLFFAIAGAGINFNVLAEAWVLVLVLTVSRLAFTWFGTRLGASAAAEEPLVRDNIWMGFLTQAGITLGIAVIVADNFPGWGVTFKSVVIGSIAIFQVIGPVLFKFGLVRAGNIPKKKNSV
ncbi:MAG: cation:proton antiporter [Candidatus Glassbacteria bacterium]|nr:cation:proton antiporter [Candidatus Glassbacteria bacterium]